MVKVVVAHQCGGEERFLNQQRPSQEVDLIYRLSLCHVAWMLLNLLMENSNPVTNQVTTVTAMQSNLRHPVTLNIHT